MAEDELALPVGELDALLGKPDQASVDRVMRQLSEDPVEKAVEQALDESPSGLVDKEGEPLPPHYSDDWDLILWPDSRLTNVAAEEVTVFDEDLERCGARMLAVMYKNGGIGLAAPQVGWNKRVIVLDVAPGYGAPVILCNPVVVETIGDKKGAIEGCLSFPTVRLKVMRPESVKVTAQTMNGEVAEIEVSGLLARVLQHEVDHLSGVLMTAHASPVGKVQVKGKLKKLKRYKEHLEQKARERRVSGNTFPPKNSRYK